MLADLLETDAYPVILACLYGDAAAHELGYTPQGLSERAGMAVALADALAAGIKPESVLTPVP